MLGTTCLLVFKKKLQTANHNRLCMHAYLSYPTGQQQQQETDHISAWSGNSEPPTHQT